MPLGVLLVITAKDGLKPQRALNTVLGWIVNIGRSIPFIILLVAIIPFTRLVVGTSLGVPGAIVPLTVAAIPFVGRMVEQSLAEVDGGPGGGRAKLRRQYVADRDQGQAARKPAQPGARPLPSR